MIIPFMEQGTIVEGELIQSTSEKCPTLVDHFFSMIDVLFEGSGSKGGTVGLGEGSVKGSLDGWIWTKEGSFPSWISKKFEVFLRFSKGSSSNR
jgi:hypothetical protein